VTVRERKGGLNEHFRDLHSPPGNDDADHSVIDRIWYLRLRLLSVAALPAVDFPTIQITATLPGASPETWAPRCGADRAAAFDNRRHYLADSTSSLGITSITIQFDLNRNIDGAALDVQTALTVRPASCPSK